MKRVLNTKSIRLHMVSWWWSLCQNLFSMLHSNEGLYTIQIHYIHHLFCFSLNSNITHADSVLITVDTVYFLTFIYIWESSLNPSILAKVFWCIFIFMYLTQSFHSHCFLHAHCISLSILFRTIYFFQVSPFFTLLWTPYPTSKTSICRRAFDELSSS